MKIYRLEATERHLLWVVTTLLNQARGRKPNPNTLRRFMRWPSPTAPQGRLARGDEETAQGVRLLALAEAMLKKCIDSGGLATQSALLILLQVLQAQGKHSKALAAAAGPLGVRCIALESDRQRLMGDLAAAAGDWGAAAAAQRALLEANPDDWLATVAALDALLAGTSAGAAPAAGDAASALQQLSLDSAAGALESAAALVSELLQTAEARGGAHVVGRGPYLAAVELDGRRMRLSPTPEAATALAAAVLAYWQRQGDSTSCAADVRPYSWRLAAAAGSEKGGNAAVWLGRALLEAAAAEAATMDAAVAAAGGAEVAAAAAGEATEAAKTLQRGLERSLRRFGAAHRVRCDLGLLQPPPAALAAALAEARSLAAELLRVARATRFVAAGADPREQTPSDVLFLTAAEALACAVAGTRAAADSVDGTPLPPGLTPPAPRPQLFVLSPGACAAGSG